MRYLLVVFVLAAWLAASAFPAPYADRIEIGSATRAAKKCVQIFYDRAPNQVPEYNYGRLHALYLQNLLGHFPALQQYVIPIEAYTAGQIDRCEANLYLGTLFDNALPDAFLDDFTVARQSVAWVGYNLWRLGAARLQKAFGARYRGLSTVDWAHLDGEGIPGFFREYDYLGQVFHKWASYDPNKPRVLNAAFEITLLDLDPGSPAKIISRARHSTLGTSSPYIINQGNLWFVADQPFSYISPEDRYLIFADVLFDIVGEKPLRPGKPIALVRFEDVHPQLPLWQIQGAIDAAEKVGVFYGISVIPFFRDPYQKLVNDPKNKEIKLHERPQFVQELKFAAKNKGSFLFHGYTHQFEELRNPDGTSGADFEFWDMHKSQSLTKDSAQLVVDRLEAGYSILKQAGITTSAWLTPHYAASPLDNIIFGQMFLWNVGRVNYYPFQAKQAEPLPMVLSLDVFGGDAHGQRMKYFADLTVNYKKEMGAGGQFFPYELYGDVYGQRLIPENVGFLIPGTQPDSFNIDDMIRIMKRNRGLRDTWASYFLHPYLVKSKNGVVDTKEIERLFQTTLDLGYRFVSLKDWTKHQLKENRPAPIETMLPASGILSMALDLPSALSGTLKSLGIRSRSEQLPLAAPQRHSGCDDLSAGFEF